MKLRVPHFLAGFLLLCCSGRCDPLDSPAGTWETTISGRDQGIAFLTFSADSTLSGYGMTLHSFGLFSIFGNWESLTNGRLVIKFTGGTNVYRIKGTLVGKVAANKRFVGAIPRPHGRLTLTGVPATTTPYPLVISANTTERGQTMSETIELMNSGSYSWGVFEYTGSGSVPEGNLNLSGEVLISSKGTCVIHSVAESPTGEVSTSSSIGILNTGDKVSFLRGITNKGAPVRTRVNWTMLGAPEFPMGSFEHYTVTFTNSFTNPVQPTPGGAAEYDPATIMMLEEAPPQSRYVLINGNSKQ